MPNYCTNYVTIKCTTTKLAKKLLKLLKDDDELIDRYMPSFTDYYFLSDIDKLNILYNDNNYKNEITDQIYKQCKCSVEDFINNLYNKLKIINKNKIFMAFNYKGNIVRDLETGDYLIDKSIKNIIDVVRFIDDYKNNNYKSDYIKIDRFINQNILDEYRTRMLPNKFKYKTGLDDIDDPYNTFIEKVGTKWFPEIIYSTREKNIIYLSLQTAWAPCNNFFNYLSYLFSVKIINDFIEEGMCFYGRNIYNCGEELLDDYISCDNSIILNYNFLKMRDELNEFDIVYYSQYIIDLYNEDNDTDYDYEDGIDEIGEYKINKLLKAHDINKEIRKFIIKELKEGKYLNYKTIKIRRI